ncbi:MAG: prepilin-type N-terminal cleavage/methylation domain-containing protein [Deinococcales bacterium]
MRAAARQGVGRSSGAAAASGLTLLEVLVALAVLTLAVLGWVRLEATLAAAERSGQLRREVAGLLRAELQLQRNVPAEGCLTPLPAPGWTCRVERRCLAGSAPCQLEGVRVSLTAPGSAPVAAATAVWWPLQRAQVEAPP